LRRRRKKKRPSSPSIALMSTGVDIIGPLVTWGDDWESPLKGAAAGSIGELPGTKQDTCFRRSKEVEKSRRQVKASRRAYLTLVHDHGLGGFPIIGHGDGFAAMASRIALTELRDVHSYDKVTPNVGFAAGTEPDLIPRPAGANKNVKLVKGAGLEFR